MDEKDRLILFELMQDCRQSLNKIAKAVGLPKQTVGYRIKNLEDDRVITKYALNVNYQKLGLNRHSLYVDLAGVHPQEVDQYLRYITNIDEVSCCYMLDEVSKWKLYISIWTKTIERFDQIQSLILAKFNEHIKDYVSFQSVKSYTYFHRILNTKKKAKVDIKEGSENIPIKEIDKKIIHELKGNSKMPLLDIAKKLHSKIETVKKRFAYLVKNDIIQRFYPIVDRSKVGYTEYTYLSRIDATHEKDIEKFIEYARSDPRFVIIIKAVGYVNLYYAFLAKDKGELKEISSKIDDLIGKAVLKTYKIEVEKMIS